MQRRGGRRNRGRRVRFGCADDEQAPIRGADKYARQAQVVFRGDHHDIEQTHVAHAADHQSLPIHPQRGVCGRVNVGTNADAQHRGACMLGE